ncbi:MAG: hypothetical protein ACYDEX_05820 [Mobilitalea sp.]
MWVNRAGQDSMYINFFLDNSKIYIPWNGYEMELSKCETIQEFREVVMKETKSENRTSISNWAGQLHSFCNEMQIGDYVLIPHQKSRVYTLAKITSNYQFDNKGNNGLYHYRNIEIIVDKINRDIFPQDIQFSLGAFRTIFKAKNEEIILEKIRNM